MRGKKLVFGLIIQLIITFSLFSLNFSQAGYLTDPTGDAGGINACDITQVDILVSYNSLPVDDDITLKITLLEAPLMDVSHTIRYDYNFRLDTNLSSVPDTTTWSSEVFEYVAHLDCRWVSDTWLNTSYLLANRYYLTSDGSAKVMGTYYWNPNTDTWQASNPDLEVGEVIGNTVQWDVTSAIFREQPLGTGYLIQGVAGAWYGFALKDIGPNTGWCDEFDNTPYTENAPELSNGKVTPLNGTTITNFVYSVVYTDADNDAPLFVKVNIDDYEYSMNKNDTNDNNYIDGCVYTYSKYLAAGNHTYSFIGNDGEFQDVLLPSSGNYTGPYVLEPETSPTQSIGFANLIWFAIPFVSVIMITFVVFRKTKKR